MRDVPTSNGKHTKTKELFPPVPSPATIPIPAGSVGCGAQLERWEEGAETETVPVWEGIHVSLTMGVCVQTQQST
jgi:hypothetical protein